VKPGTVASLPITVAEIVVGSEIIRFELKIYKGRPLFSAWRFYKDKAGDLRAGRHGLACGLDRLPDIAAAIVSAVERARAEGLLPDDEGGR
jgi:hypothetical protein